jgi:hypothetical protein
MNTNTPLQSCLIQYSLDCKCFRKNVVKTIHVFHFKYFIHENVAIYEIIWKNMVQSENTQMTM